MKNGVVYNPANVLPSKNPKQTIMERDPLRPNRNLFGQSSAPEMENHKS
jgi:hypothetical protein